MRCRLFAVIVGGLAVLTGCEAVDTGAPANGRVSLSITQFTCDDDDDPTDDEELSFLTPTNLTVQANLIATVDFIQDDSKE